jgi:hypothetical protein
MRVGFVLIAWTMGLAGCAAPLRVTELQTTAGSPAPANLALGSSAEVAALATLMTERSDWPSVDSGYRMDDQTFYATTTYDVQSHFDRFGSLYYEAVSVRTGVRLGGRSSP